MPVAGTWNRFRTLGAQALRDLFDQKNPFGRLSLVQVLMLAGDTLVTISLAGSLFFSISPKEAESKVFFYLLLTLAPFAIVSPLLGPLIDWSRNARRAMVVFSAAGRAVLCPLMARDIHSFLLFPEAFLILVLSKLYLVTRGALVPEMAAVSAAAGTGPPGAPAQGDGGAGPPRVPTFGHGEAMGFPAEVENVVDEGAGVPAAQLGRARKLPTQFAVLNARLTLLGTLAGFVASVPGIILLKLAGAPGVLWFDAVVFVAAAVAGARLPVMSKLRQAHGHRPAQGLHPAPEWRAKVPETASAQPGDGFGQPGGGGPAQEVDRDVAKLQPIAHPEVLLGLSTMSLIRGLAGFLVFLLAFGLRREHAALWWYGFALGASGAGALVGLVLVPRVRQRLVEQQILLCAIWLISVAAIGAAFWGALPAQAMLAFVVGVAGSMAQPSFDAMAQRFVPLAEQGRAFARFATRQQLVWVVGAIIPVIVQFPLPAGDVVMAAVAGAGGLFYLTSRRALRGRALPRNVPGPRPSQ